MPVAWQSRTGAGNERFYVGKDANQNVLAAAMAAGIEIIIWQYDRAMKSFKFHVVYPEDESEKTPDWTLNLAVRMAKAAAAKAKMDFNRTLLNIFRTARRMS